MSEEKENSVAAEKLDQESNGISAKDPGNADATASALGGANSTKDNTA